MKMRTSLVSMVYVLCLSLVVGVLVLTAPPAASGIEAEAVDIHPETLNLNSNGTWITAYIELPEGYDVEDINVTTVYLGTIRAESKPWEIGDYDEDGVSDMMVKFDGQTVIDYIWMFKLAHMGIEPLSPLSKEGVEVELTITGELIDGPPFEGHDTIRVIYHG